MLQFTQKPNNLAQLTRHSRAGQALRRNHQQDVLPTPAIRLVWGGALAIGGLFCHNKSNSPWKNVTELPYFDVQYLNLYHLKNHLAFCPPIFSFQHYNFEEIEFEPLPTFSLVTSLNYVKFYFVVICQSNGQVLW